jgi:hypothetical protein
LLAGGVATVWIIGGVGWAKAFEPPCGNPERDGICWEVCALPQDVKASAEGPSALFLDKLASIGATRHHIDSRYGAARLERSNELRIANVGARQMKVWEEDGRYAGPCHELRAVFRSKAVSDTNRGDVVDLYELRYPTEQGARRVADLLTRAWDWNYHPFLAVHAGRSVIVTEGRHRDWSELNRVAAHFGSRIRWR